MRKSKFLFEQENDVVEYNSDYYKILLKTVGYDSELLASLPPFNDKKIILNGNLNLSKTPAKSLHNIIGVNGDLDISDSEIGDVSQIKVKGILSTYGSRYAKIRAARIRREQLAENQERREEKVWDLNNPDIDKEGIYANVAFKYFKSEFPNAKIKSEEDEQKLNVLGEKLEQLLNKQKQYEQNGRDITGIVKEIENIEDQINEINDSIDVYSFNPTGNHYDLLGFKLISDNEYDGTHYSVGDEDEANSSLEEYYQDRVDNPTEYFSSEMLHRFADEEAILDVIREIISQDMYDYPSAYFDESEYELSDDDQEKLDELENELSDYQERLEMYDYGTSESEQIETHIESLEEQIEELNESRRVTDEMIEDRIDEKMDDARRNVMGYARDYGIEVENYLDSDSILEYLMSDKDYGSLTGTDDYGVVYIGDEKYIVVDNT